MPHVTRGGVLLVLAALLVACGGEAADPAPEHHSGADGDITMHDMNMGDPNAVPAGEVPNAEVVSGKFELLDTAPEGYQNLAGNATMARHDGGTTVTIELSGLQPGTEYISHVHEGECADGGAEHYKFDPDGGDQPPNEIHLAFTSTAEGTASMTTENEQTAGPDARSVVVHPREFTDNRLACAPLS